MDDLHVMADAVRERFVVLADWLFGCSHRKTTFPRTLQTSVSADEQPGTPAATYVVCLQCGRHLSYDWTTMRIIKQRTARVGGAAGNAS